MTTRPFSRVIVIAPTRSICVNIHNVLSNTSLPPTLLQELKGQEIETAVDHLSRGGFGVVAGTGIGKTVAIRAIAKRVLCEELTIDIVTREHEATEKTWTSNVIVMTPGIAFNWLKSAMIDHHDLIVIDEIHQTSDHLELSMALAKREGCTFIWMSATIDSTVYASYLNAQTVIRCDAFDPKRRALVSVTKMQLGQQLERMIEEIVQDKRGVAVFVPTRRMAEQVAQEFEDRAGLHVEFFHGGESAEKLRPFLTGDIQRPFMIVMTNAGASSLNVVGLDTVVIVDQCYQQIVQPGGKKMLEKSYLGPNELLQMGGRVNGRAVSGKIIILSDREIDFHCLKPVVPRFTLGGELRRLALTCAKLEIDVRELDLIGSFEHGAYAREVQRFIDRGLIMFDGTMSLTDYGRQVEELPVEPHWGEVLVTALNEGRRDLINLLVVMASADQLYRLVRRDWEQDARVTVMGSDHMTTYNIIADALTRIGWIDDSTGFSEYRLYGDEAEELETGLFAQWASDRRVVMTEVQAILLAMKSVYRQLELPLADPMGFHQVTQASALCGAFVDLLARVQSLEFVQSQFNARAGQVYASNEGVASDESVLGTIRYWIDEAGNTRANVEGTNIPRTLVEKYMRVRVLSLIGMTPDGERVFANVSMTFAGEPIFSGRRALDPYYVPQPEFAQVPILFACWLAGQSSEVMGANRLILAQMADLNARVGSERFAAMSQGQYETWLVEQLGGVCRFSGIRDISTLQLPDLSPIEVERVLRDYPDTCCVLERQLPVIYSAQTEPVVLLTEEMIEKRQWLDLPDEGIRLPSGTVVAVGVDFCDGCVLRHTHMPELKQMCATHLHESIWKAWKKRPAIALPDQHDPEAKLSEIVKTVYGTSVLDHSPLLAYGTVGLNEKRKRSSDPWFAIKWFQTFKEAERARAEAKSKLLALNEHAREHQTFVVKKQEAEALRVQLNQLVRSQGSPRDLRHKAKHQAEKGLPYSLAELERWISDARFLMNH